MQYKGFVAKYHFAINLGVYIGEIINSDDVISFSAENLKKLKEVMMEAVDQYLLTVEVIE